MSSGSCRRTRGGRLMPPDSCRRTHVAGLAPADADPCLRTRACRPVPPGSGRRTRASRPVSPGSCPNGTRQQARAAGLVSADSHQQTRARRARVGVGGLASASSRRQTRVCRRGSSWPQARAAGLVSADSRQQARVAGLVSADLRQQTRARVGGVGAVLRHALCDEIRLPTQAAYEETPRTRDLAGLRHKRAQLGAPPTERVRMPPTASPDLTSLACPGDRDERMGWSCEPQFWRPPTRGGAPLYISAQSRPKKPILRVFQIKHVYVFECLQTILLEQRGQLYQVRVRVN